MLDSPPVMKLLYPGWKNVSETKEPPQISWRHKLWRGAISILRTRRYWTTPKWNFVTAETWLQGVICFLLGNSPASWGCNSRRFGTLYRFHLHGQMDEEWLGWDVRCIYTWRGCGRKVAEPMGGRVTGWGRGVTTGCGRGRHKQGVTGGTYQNSGGCSLC